MERRRKYLADIRLIVHSIRDNMRKQRMTIRKENKALKEDLITSSSREDKEDLAAQGRRIIKEVRTWLSDPNFLATDEGAGRYDR